jgi:hypothetical protein
MHVETAGRHCADEADRLVGTHLDHWLGARAIGLDGPGTRRQEHFAGRLGLP